MRIKPLIAFIFLVGAIFIPASVWVVGSVPATDGDVAVPIPTPVPQGTAFSYQGVLNNNGAPANGTFQMSFSLWMALSGGLQVGSTVGPMSVSVANGGFTAVLDFGAA